MSQHQGRRAEVHQTDAPSFCDAECDISLKNTLLMYRQMPKLPIALDQASMLPGTDCARTIRRHYWMVETYIEILLYVVRRFRIEILRPSCKI